METGDTDVNVETPGMEILEEEPSEIRKKMETDDKGTPTIRIEFMEEIGSKMMLLDSQEDIIIYTPGIEICLPWFSYQEPKPHTSRAWPDRVRFDVMASNTVMDVVHTPLLGAWEVVWGGLDVPFSWVQTWEKLRGVSFNAKNDNEILAIMSWFGLRQTKPRHYG